jgi:outer membrane protein assembly factor BamB
MLTVLAAFAIMPGCVQRAPSNTPLHAHTSRWATYQHSSDRNAVFENYAIVHDWSYNSKSKMNSGLALVGNTLLFTTFTHKLVALDVRNGSELWQAGVGNIAMSTPIVAGNMVYVGTGKSGLLPRTMLVRMQHPHEHIWGVPGGDEIAAFDLGTGARRWSFRTVGEDMPSPVYDRGRLIFANGDSHAYALNAETGERIWSTDIGGISTMSSAVTAGNAVIVGVCRDGMRDSTSVALDSATGKILWKSPYGHCDAAPAYAAGKVFVSDLIPGDTYLQGRPIVAALDPKTGKPFWIYQGATQGIWSIVASDEAAVAGTYANGTYYQAEPFTDEVLAFDAQSGRLRWTFHTSGPAKMSPVIKDGRLYVGDTAGLLYTLDAQDGHLLEMREFKDPFGVSPPIIAGNKLLIANGTSVHAIPITGRPKLAEPVGWAIAASPPAKHKDQQ